jgi:hypothetical protein
VIDRGFAQADVRENAKMNLEVTIWSVLPGRDEEFEGALRAASTL